MAWSGEPMVVHWRVYPYAHRTQYQDCHYTGEQQQAVHGDLADRPLIAAQLDRLVDVRDRLMAPLSRIQHGAGPGRARQRLQPAEDRGAPPTDGDEVDAAGGDPGQLGVVHD